MIVGREAEWPKYSITSNDQVMHAILQTFNVVSCVDGPP